MQNINIFILLYDSLIPHIQMHVKPPFTFRTVTLQQEFVLLMHHFVSTSIYEKTFIRAHEPHAHLCLGRFEEGAR